MKIQSFGSKEKWREPGVHFDLDFDFVELTNELIFWTVWETNNLKWKVAALKIKK